MRFRDLVALNFAPLFLRVALGVTFLLAGASKVFVSMEVSGEEAAILANYGVIQPAGAAPHVTPPPPPELPEPEEDEDEGGTARGPGLERGPTLASQSGYGLAGVVWQPPRYVASDFPEPVKVRSMNGMVLFLHGAIHPSLDPETSEPRMALWPDLDRTRDFDPWPVYAARAVAFTELFGGLAVLLGFLTRFGAIGLACVMVGAMWLTQIGPAIQGGGAFLGVLPNHPWHDVKAWQDLLWQFSLFAMGVSLFFTGSGTLAVDRIIGSGPGDAPRKKARPRPPENDE